MDTLRDRRETSLVFIHSTVDDMGLTTRAFRVYCHLARRAGRDNTAFPSYQSIGDTCFSPDEIAPGWRRKLAMSAVQELIENGMLLKVVQVKSNGGQTSNLYELTPQNEWRGGVRQDALGGVRQDAP